MPIQPIDLQTLFAHINQVGKDQAALKEGLHAQQEAQADELIKEKKHQDKSVNESSEVNEDNQKIKDDNSNNQNGKKGESEHDSDTQGDEKRKMKVFTDPDLGKNLDITG